MAEFNHSLPDVIDFVSSAVSIVNKNLWAYGASKFLNIWISDIGYVGPIMTNTALCLLWICFGIPLFFFGKRLRRLSARSTVHQAY